MPVDGYLSSLFSATQTNQIKKSLFGRKRETEIKTG